MSRRETRWEKTGVGATLVVAPSLANAARNPGDHKGRPDICPLS